MCVNEVLAFVDELIFSVKKYHISDLRAEIFKRCWEGQKYTEMYNSLGYSYEHVKKEGCELFKTLSEVLDEKVTQEKFKQALKQKYKKNQSVSHTTLQEPQYSDTQQSTSNSLTSNSESSSPKQYCKEVPNVSKFVGRVQELSTLEQFLLKEDCRVVLVYGKDGIGKTALSVKLAQRVKSNFDYLICLSLKHSPPLHLVLAELIEFFSEPHDAASCITTDDYISQLLENLQINRCLLVLNGVEALLDTGKFAGKYREGYKDYKKLFEQVAKVNHHSCLVLTSSEMPREIYKEESKKGPVRAYKLTNLTKNDAYKILEERGLVKEEEWDNLIEMYGANPLMLKIVAATIINVFNGKTSDFIKENTVFLGQIKEILDDTYERLSSPEVKVMHSLAVASQTVCFQQLREEFAPDVSSSILMEALESLLQRSLIEKHEEGGKISYALQLVIRKYVLSRSC